MTEATAICAARKHVQSKDQTNEIALTGEAMIAFISGAQTNVGKSTFYNLKSEQQQALVDQHAPMLNNARPFYSLMILPQGVNDVNKQLIAWNLIEHTLPANEEYTDSEGLRHKHSQQTKWENELILQAFENMSVPRVFDFIADLQKRRVTKKRALYLIRAYLQRNRSKWPLWAIKYRTDFKRALRHVHVKFNNNDRNNDPVLITIWRYLKYNEHENCPQLIQDYVAVQNGDQSKLANLPSSVAEGFMTKFGLSTDEFWKLFTSGGGQFTQKEKRTKAESVRKAGASTGFNMKSARLFDLLVYLRSLDQLPKPEAEIRELLTMKAKEVAKTLAFSLEKVGLILDTSISMSGTKDQPYHPMLRGLAISLVLEQVSEGFKEYRTTESNQLFPVLKNQSNYAGALIKALKDGCETIIFVGDGYENAPFEGMLHSMLYALKKKIDKKNKIMILHFNPVFASEAMDVRSLSSVAASIGIRTVDGLNEAMFLAVAKHKPMLAVAKFAGHLLKLQKPKTAELMPQAIRKAIADKKLLTDEKV